MIRRELRSVGNKGRGGWFAVDADEGRWLRGKDGKGENDVARGIGCGSGFHHDSIWYIRYDRSWIQQLQDNLVARGTSAYKYEVIGSLCKIEQGNFPSRSD